MRFVLALLLLASPLAAQEFDFYDRGPYRPQVPRPEITLGYHVGSRQTMYYQQQAVLDAMIAAAPDRVRTEVIGTTAEGKVMRLLIISAPENLARLGEIQADLARLADPGRTGPEAAKAIALRTPVTLLLIHSVHGNEPAGFEAAMQTVYQLLAADEPATLEILRRSVVLVNPSQNPDGHERFAAWSNSVAVGADEPAALEQAEPWSVWGRYSHYRFDMNRDLMAQSQNESRALAGVFRRWRPQVIADLHGTTEAYFFPPVAEAHNLNLPPRTYEWFERFGRANGSAFDRYGWQYFVRDVFDFFYPGYIDMWPSLRGGIGMTFETDGGPELRKRKADGSVVTLEMAIAHHYVASMATLEFAAAHGQERLTDFYDFHVSGAAEARRRPFRRVVFTSADSTRALWLARRLAEEEVEVTRLTRPWSTPRANGYLGGAAAKRAFPAGAFVVDLAQPEARLATAMLEPRAAFDSSFVRQQLAAFERNRRRAPNEPQENYEFYDVTAWSLPLTLGLDAWWTDDTSPVTGDRVTAADSLALPPPPARAASAYLFGNQDEVGTRLAMRLLREGFRVGATTKPIVADGRRYPPGTFVVRVQRNPAALHLRIAELSREVRAPVTAVQSAFPDSGQFGVGSSAVRPLHAPRVLLAAGSGVGTTSFGALWFYFDHELGLPVTPIELAAFSDMDVGPYNVLVLPDGSGGRLWRELGDDGAEKLKRWVREGGAVIAMGGSVGLLARKELELTTSEPFESDSVAPKDTTVTVGVDPGPPLVSPSASGGNEPGYIPGSIFRATLDQTHWLTFGYPGKFLPVMLQTSLLRKPSRTGANPVVFTGGDLLLSGWAWPDNTERLLQNTVWASVESPGEGSVITFADVPVERGFWRGPAKLLTNAILFGPGR
jgi:hypothetical protein